MAMDLPPSKTLIHSSVRASTSVTEVVHSQSFKCEDSIGPSPPEEYIQPNLEESQTDSFI